MGNKKFILNADDFGISNDLILKLIKLGINKNKIINRDYDSSLFDEYENIILDEYSTFNDA